MVDIQSKIWYTKAELKARLINTETQSQKGK